MYSLFVTRFNIFCDNFNHFQCMYKYGMFFGVVSGTFVNIVQTGYIIIANA